MRAKGDVAGIFHHESEKIAKHRVFERIEFGVIDPDRVRAFRVA